MGDNGYKHGEMDTSSQEKTFDGFVRWSVRGAIICLAIVILLAIFAQ